MATTSKLNLQTQLFIFISGVFLIFVCAFAFFQYNREKAYKVDILHSRLQTYNYQLCESLSQEELTDSAAFSAYVAAHPLERLRVTVIAEDGRVLIDSKDADVSTLANHLQRQEVQQALHNGSGYDIQRVSSLNGERYFYSATWFPQQKVIIRSAVPYSAELTASLRADHTFLWLSIIIYLILCAVIWSYTRQVGHHVDATIENYKGQVREAEEEKTRIKHQLTQNTAHELKTPAASIQGYLETLLSDPDIPADQRQHFLERSYAQSRRMCNLLQDMATLTSLDEATSGSNSSTLTKSQVDVAAIIRTVLDDLSLTLREKNIRVETSIPQRVPIQGNPSLVYSIFRNILDNAIAYSGATEITIRYAESEEDSEKGDGKRLHEFTLADNGQGVPAEHLPHLFERFYRVDKGRSRQLGGTGLGLAIVKNAVAFHGGTVAASATQPHGLTIALTLEKTPSDFTKGEGESRE